ncbi:YciI family protein [Ruegeria jejuensis]|uniref:YciI family protein n=1 Tax=Ruegeria jejuensis TaxID=3233338 RepID=UPI00355C0A13
MFIILLRFSENRAQVADHMDGHRDWLKQGFDEGVFLLAGSLKQAQGGGILAQAGSREEIAARVQADPFVAADVVTAEILELDPARADDRLSFLMK